MNIEEIKKIIYKEKPKANLSHIRKGVAYYGTNCSIGTIQFAIPVIDMGDATFDAEMDAKLLNRYIVIEKSEIV